jgi:hypothetical protein
MLEDLTMLATLPVDQSAVRKAADDADIDKAAAGETMPSPKEECEECEDTDAGRIARRGQDPALHNDECSTDPK